MEIIMLYVLCMEGGRSGDEESAQANAVIQGPLPRN